jgi:hypothetical protein
MKTPREYQVRIKQLAHTSGYRYVLGAAGVLGLSTTIWSFVIARLQQGNADQLAGGFLFWDAETFRQAQFPASHTQVLKWPIFWLLGALHSTSWALTVTTMMLCLVTVGTFAYLLFRIVRQPELLTVLYLGLACVLALVPAQVLGGVASPLSMALLTGRNIEYPLYVGVLVLLLPAAQKYEWRRWSIATLLLGILLVSDQLFLTLSLGGAGGLLLYSYVWRRRSLVTTAWVWVLVSVCAWVLSQLQRWVLGFTTGITGTSTGPYGYATTFTEVHGAVVYGVKGLLLNFGISLSSGWISVLPALLNTLLLGLIVYAGYVTLRCVSQSAERPDRAVMLSLLLGMSTFAAFVAYVGTDHPVSADARYLTIALFAGFVMLAAYSRTIRLNPKLLYSCGAVLILGVGFALIAVVVHTNQTIASDPLRARNQRVARILAAHHIQILVGDYWRVLPIKEQTRQASQQILPLGSCLQPRQSLISGAWERDLYTHSFAYLLPLQPYGTPYGRCTLQTIMFVYGKPTTVVRITGNRQNPAELLLFYNNGAAKLRGNKTVPPTPVFGVPTEGIAKPTGSTMVPLADPS